MGYISLQPLSWGPSPRLGWSSISGQVIESTGSTEPTPMLIVTHTQFSSISAYDSRIAMLGDKSNWKIMYRSRSVVHHALPFSVETWNHYWLPLRTVSAPLQEERNIRRYPVCRIQSTFFTGNASYVQHILHPSRCSVPNADLFGNQGTQSIS